jgi:hypothetical protein
MANLLERQVSTRVGRVQEAHFPHKAADKIPILRCTCWRIFLLQYSLERPVCVSELAFNYSNSYFFFFGLDSPQWVMASSFTSFLDHTQRRTRVGRTPLDKWSARRRDLYLTTHNNHNRQTSITPMGFELTISADERPQTYALDRTVTGTGMTAITVTKNEILSYWSRPETLVRKQLEYNQLQYS